jgi:acetyl-CoA carboxylase biotin carboxyl carrier protein
MKPAVYGQTLIRNEQNREGKSMKLTEDEVIQILKLVEESRFDELRLEMGDLKLHVRKGGCMAPDISEDASQIMVSPKPVAEGTIVHEERVPQAPAEKVSITLEESFVPIKAPMLGTFYRRPSPGSPPYVEVGTFVQEDETVCLLEVMKVFNSVKAGVRGYIAKIGAESGDLVEYGQPLFWVKPADSP